MLVRLKMVKHPLTTLSSLSLFDRASRVYCIDGGHNLSSIVIVINSDPFKMLAAFLYEKAKTYAEQP